MKFTVPVIYEPARGKRKLASGMEIELAEISSAETELAIESAFRYGGMDLTRKFRLFDGRLWEETFVGHEPLSGQHIAYYSLREPVGDQYCAGGAKGIDFRPTDWHSSSMLYSAGVSPDVADNTPEALVSPMAAAYRRTAENHLLIDGLIYRRSGGPGLSILQHTNQRDELIWDDGGDFDRNNSMYRRFRADELDFAREMTRQVFGRDLPVRGTAPVIHIPESLTVNFTNWSIESFAWVGIWLDRAMHMGDVRPAKAQAIVTLRNTLAKRWPDRPLTFNAGFSDFRPYGTCEVDFPPGDDLIRHIEAVFDAPPSTKGWLRKTLDLLLARHSHQPTRETALPSEDEDALDLGAAP